LPPLCELTLQALQILWTKKYLQKLIRSLTDLLPDLIEGNIDALLMKRVLPCGGVRFDRIDQCSVDVENDDTHTEKTLSERLSYVMFAYLLLAFFVDQPLIEELNQMRSNPAGYASLLEDRLKYFRGDILRLPNQVPIQTKEGPKAVKEAIRVLRATRSLPQIEEHSRLTAAAREHVRQNGPKGLVQHARLPPGVGEVMSFGPQQPRDVVIDLLVDDGVPNRGHRLLLLDKRFRYAGAACGPHKTYGTMCVIDLSIEQDAMPASSRRR
jgi:uncharacterized protein YkwD